MKNLKIIILIFVYLKVQMGYGVDYFGYAPHEQNSWTKYFMECGGSQQSPIWIDRKKAIEKRTIGLHLNGYGESLPVLRLTNTGYTVDLSIDSKFIGGNLPYITIGKDSKRYTFQGLHLHWGKTNDEGSEHIIDELKTPLELHMVHKSAKTSSTVKKDQVSMDSLAVLAVLYKLDKKESSGLNPIFRNLLKVKHVESAVPVLTSFSLNSFLPQIDTNNFYSYTGSLTTPPCTQGVTWIVFNDMLTISPIQLKKLRKLRRLDKQGSVVKILENHRWTQPLNNRTVEHVFRP